MKIRFYHNGRFVERKIYLDDGVWEGLLQDLTHAYRNLKFYPIDKEFEQLDHVLEECQDDNDKERLEYEKSILEYLLKEEQDKYKDYDNSHYFLYSPCEEVNYGYNVDIIYVASGVREDGLKALVEEYDFEESENLEFFPFYPHYSNSGIKILDVENEAVYYVDYRDYEYQLFHEFKKDADGDPLKIGNLKAINHIGDDLYKFRVELDGYLIDDSDAGMEYYERGPQLTDPDKEFYFEGKVYQIIPRDKFDSRLEGE